MQLVTYTEAPFCDLQIVLFLDIIVPSAPGCWNELRRGSFSPSPACVGVTAGDAIVVARQGALGRSLSIPVLYLHHIYCTAVPALVLLTQPDVLLHRGFTSFGMAPTIHFGQFRVIPTQSTTERCTV